MKKLLLPLFMLSAVSLTACNEYKEDWIPPATPMGTACVSQCNSSKQQCQIAQQQLQQQCQANHQRAVADYQRCKAMNPSTSQCSSYRTKTETINGQTVTKQECTSTRYGSPCGDEPRNSCSNSTNMSMCDANYKSCFTSCGGVINRYEVK